MDTAALAPGIAPPQRIDLGDLLVRHWRSEDLIPRFEAIAASFDHLHPWMDWLAEPMTLERQHDFGDAAAASWPSPDGSCHYGIFDAEGTLLGAIGLHDRVGPAHARTRLLVPRVPYRPRSDHPCGRRAHPNRVDTHRHRPHRNPLRRIQHSQRRSPRRLGYRLDRVEPREVRAPAETGRGMFWVADRQSREM